MVSLHVICVASRSLAQYIIGSYTPSVIRGSLVQPFENVPSPIYRVLGDFDSVGKAIPCFSHGKRVNLGVCDVDLLVPCGALWHAGCFTSAPRPHTDSNATAATASRYAPETWWLV